MGVAITSGLYRPVHWKGSDLLHSNYTEGRHSDAIVGFPPRCCIYGDALVGSRRDGERASSVGSSYFGHELDLKPLRWRKRMTAERSTISAKPV